MLDWLGVQDGYSAFEPMPRNLKHIRRHLSLNHLANVVIVPYAVSDKSGTIRMSEGDSPSEFHADPQGLFEMVAIARDSWRSEAGSPCLIWSR